MLHEERTSGQGTFSCWVVLSHLWQGSLCAAHSAWAQHNLTRPYVMLSSSVCLGSSGTKMQEYGNAVLMCRSCPCYASTCLRSRSRNRSMKLE